MRTFGLAGFTTGSGCLEALGMTLPGASSIPAADSAHSRAAAAGRRIVEMVFEDLTPRESFVGGPFAFVRDGDVVELDVPGRRLSLRVPDEELGRRRAGWRLREVDYPRGFGRLYARHVRQADKGCGFDFLEGTAPVPEPEIH